MSAGAAGTPRPGRGRAPTRRAVIAGLAASVAPPVGAARAADAGGALAAIERRHGGRLGVLVLDTGSGRAIAGHRADERFLMCSTFKLVLAARVLASADAGDTDLAAPVRYRPRDLIGYSPVTRAHAARGTLPIGALCAAIVLVSDNTAANLLSARFGGPAALTAYVRGLGDDTTRFDRYETAASERDGPLDTTTPRAFAALVRTLLLGGALAPASRARLDGWMVASTTGAARLRAAFPRDWQAGDKTGTGDDGICDDVALVHPPGRAPVIVAAYHDAPGMPLASQEATLRDAGAACVAAIA